MALIRVKLTAHSVKTRQARLGLSSNVDMITGSALTGKCPASPALEGGGKGHTIKEKYLTGKLHCGSPLPPSPQGIQPTCP
jgi:hypothetical protein